MKYVFQMEVYPEFGESAEELIEYFTESIGDHISFTIKFVKTEEGELT